MMFQYGGQRRACLSAMLLSGTCLAGLAAAQGAGQTQVAAVEGAASGAEEIIVTGEKTARRLQDTTTSVAVIGQKQISEENLTSLDDIYERTANVAASFRTFTIRGIDSLSVSGGGASALASVYVDGAVLPNDAVTDGPLDLWDVAQVEILRGPQSTIQGRNALAGAIVIRTQDPTFDWTARGRAIFADYGSNALGVAAGGPILEDQVAFRVAAEERRSDGTIRNLTSDSYADPYKVRTLRGKLLIEPVSLPELRLLATYAYGTAHRGEALVLRDVPDSWSNRYIVGDTPTEADTRTNIFTLEAGYEISDAWTLTGIVSWNRVDWTSTFDGDYSADPISHSYQDRVTKTLTQELRANFDYGRLKGLIGAYHAEIDAMVVGGSRTLVRTPTETLEGVLVGMFGLDPLTAATAAGLYTAALPTIPVLFSYDSPNEIKTYAIFGDASYELTDKLTLHAGFRYDREENRIANEQVVIFDGVYPDPALYGPYAPIIGGLNMVVDSFVAQANAPYSEGTKTFEAFLPKLGLTYQWTDDVATSFIVQRGYRSGGAVINSARARVSPYEAEFTWNYELSLRTQWLDRTLTVNANVYYTDWTDQQVWVNLGLNDYDTETVNAGKSHLYGFELEANYRPNDALTIYGSIGYAFTVFDEFQVSIGDLLSDFSGRPFADAPRWTAALGATYRFEAGWFVNANANFQSSTFGGFSVDDDYFSDNDARVLVNAKIGYEGENFSAFVFARNLFDEEYVVTSYQPDFPLVKYGEPRVVGVQIEARY